MARTAGQRAGLDRATVVRAAGELLAEAPDAPLSMRRVAARLEVSPNSLYSHVSDKDDLVDALLDDTLGSVDPRDDIEDPLRALRELMLGTYDALLARPELVPLYLLRRGARGANARRLGDRMIERFGELGQDRGSAAAQLRALVVTTIGYAAFDVGSSDRVDDRRRYAEALDLLLAGIAAGADGESPSA